MGKQPVVTKSLIEIQREEAQQMKQRKEQQQQQQQQQQHAIVTQQTRTQNRTVRVMWPNCGLHRRKAGKSHKQNSFVM